MVCNSLTNPSVVEFARLSPALCPHASVLQFKPSEIISVRARARTQLKLKGGSKLSKLLFSASLPSYQLFTTSLKRKSSIFATLHFRARSPP